MFYDVIEFLAFLAVVLGIGVAIGIIYLWYYIAKSFQEAAESKGFYSKKYFHLTFWLGFIGMILTAALPDRTAQMNLAKIAKQTLQESKPSSVQVNSAQTVHSEQLPDI